MIQQNPNLETIQAAHNRIASFIHRTPVLSSSSINEIAEASIYFKCENLQKVGAFKARGAMNAVLQLSAEEKKKGVCTHSSGNHAQALALAARENGANAYIVMPSNAPAVKKSAVLGYGAEVIECEPTLDARESTVQMVIDEHGATFVHPYNDYRIIAGQATAALEMYKQLEDTTLDYILTPVGGGGLLSGTALTTKYLSPTTKVIGCEPEGANDAWQSFEQGKLVPSLKPTTIADGLLTSLGDKTFPIIKEYVDQIITVNDTEIMAALKLTWERMKIIIEPSSAVCLAVILKNKSLFRSKKVGVIISGGNVDLAKMRF